MERLTTEQRLTPAQLEAIRKRAEAATAGPWYSVELERFDISSEATEREVAYSYEGNDADFIAHSREDIPALLAEVKHYSGKIAFYLDEIERLRAKVGDKDVEIAKRDAEVERLRAVIADFADYGTRHDTNPTIGGRIKRFDDVAGWVTYLRSMDDSVRRRAKEALGE